jgi:hypothetical protein
MTVAKEEIERFGLLCYVLKEKYLQPEIDQMRELLNQEVGAMIPEELFMRPAFMTRWGDQLYNPMDPGRQYPKADENETE